MKAGWIVFVGLLVGRVSGQVITEYKPAEVSKDSVYLDEKQYKKSINILGADNLPKSAINDLKDIYYSRKKKYLDNTKDHFYILDSHLTTYIQETFKTILSRLDIPDKDKYRLYITRSTIPNASNSGDWNVYFNIGLLKRMENESQIAFILCHEISHQLLNHSYKHMLSYVKEKYSKELKGELKDLSKTEYDVMDKYLELLRRKTYSTTAHIREDEKGADSLGVLLMMKTDFDATQGIRSLEILDSLEADTFTVDYRVHFDHPKFPFKDSWIAKAKTLSFGGKAVYEFDEDSIKTHPDCPKRVVYLKELLATYDGKGKQKDIQPNEKLRVMRDACKFEEAEYLYSEERYAKCIFYALHLSDEYPDDAYPVNIISRCLGKISDAFQLHKSYHYIAKPAPNFQENYNQLLRLFDRVTISEVNQLNSNFMNNNDKKFETNVTFKTLFNKYDLINQKY